MVCFIDLSLPGLALLIARSENCRNGLEQAQEGVGELDEVKWKVECGSLNWASAQLLQNLTIYT
jgi:hypothetical protein